MNYDYKHLLLSKLELLASLKLQNKRSDNEYFIKVPEYLLNKAMILINNTLVTINNKSTRTWKLDDYELNSTIVYLVNKKHLLFPCKLRHYLLE